MLVLRILHTFPVFIGVCWGVIEIFVEIDAVTRTTSYIELKFSISVKVRNPGATVAVPTVTTRRCIWHATKRAGVIPSKLANASEDTNWKT